MDIIPLPDQVSKVSGLDQEKQGRKSLYPS